MPSKFRDDISNSSGLIVSTNRQTNKETNTQMDTIENNTLTAQVVHQFISHRDTKLSDTLQHCCL